MCEKYLKITSPWNKIPDTAVFISKKKHFNKYPYCVKYSILVLTSRDILIFRPYSKAPNLELAPLFIDTINSIFFPPLWGFWEALLEGGTPEVRCQVWTGVSQRQSRLEHSSTRNCKYEVPVMQNSFVCSRNRKKSTIVGIKWCEWGWRDRQEGVT